MGLRRTPPPGVPPQAREPSAPPVEFLLEFPPSTQQQSQQIETETTSTTSPPTRTTPVEIASAKKASLSPQLPPLQPSPKPHYVTPHNFPPRLQPSSTETPQQQLINLAKVVNHPPATPQRPATSTILSARRAVRRTPGAGRLNPLPAKLTARSPHAARAFERRGATPSRERRKSGRYPTARETPRDLLRALSRQLAPTTAPFETTPLHTPVERRQSTLGSSHRASDVTFYSDPGHDVSDDEDLSPAPRLSMNLNELDQSLDDDMRLIQEPRFSVPLEDLDNTHHSIEFGRRAVSEQPWGSRSSFGIRLSDCFADFAALREDGDDGRDEGRDESIVTADESVMVSGEIEDILDDEAQERMGFVGNEDEDLTMGQRELEFDEGGSYLLPLPPGGLDLDDDDDDGRTLEINGNYDDPVQSDDEEQDLDLETASAEQVADTREPPPLAKSKHKRKPLPLSRHGHPLPQFPRTVIKKMVQTFTGSANIGNETLNAIVAASEAFFEQVSGDLATYAGHAGRKTIEDTDVVVLLKRQRQITANTTIFSLAQRHLPRELLQEVRMPLKKPTRTKKRPKQALETVEEGEEV